MNQFNANKPLPPTPTSYAWLIVAINGIILIITGVTAAIVHTKKKDD